MSPTIPKFSIFVLIVALISSMWLTDRLAQSRMAQAVQAPRGVVRAGFNKILSQIAWMRLIQYRGSLPGITKENAHVLSKKYDDLTNLDPMFDRAYEEGALEIGWQSPEESLQLLDKAMTIGKLKSSSTSWRIPFTAGFIAKNRLNNSQRAIAYLEQAVKQPGHPGYVERLLINLKAQQQFGDDPMKVLNLWVDYYSGGTGRFAGQGRMPSSEMNSESDAERNLALNQIRRVSTRIIEDAQKEMSSEKDAGRKKSFQDRIDQTEKIIRQVYAGKHICPSCFRPYNAGDEFCQHDGKKVPSYGACIKCKAVLHGVYCPKCGAKND